MTLTERLVEANHRHHAMRDPNCKTWERYSIPARGGARMHGIGCRYHGVFLSWPKHHPMPR